MSSAEIAKMAVAADLNLAIIEQRKAYIATLADSLMRSAANMMGKDKFEAMCLATMAKNPKIADCNRASVAQAFMKCAQLGLYPGSALNHVALIPYGSELQVIIQYQGLATLALRNPDVRSINAIVVYRGTSYRFDFTDDGLKLDLDFDPEKMPDPYVITKENAKDHIVGVYAVLTTKGGSRFAEFCTLAEIEARRTRGASGKGKRTPWDTDYVAMARKSGLRKLLLGGLVPLSLDAAEAMEIDEPDFEVPAEVVDATPKAATTKRTKAPPAWAAPKELPDNEIVADATDAADAEPVAAVPANSGPGGEM